MNSTNLAQLIDDLLDGSSSNDDFSHLEALLESNATARAVYYDRLHLHSALEISAEEAHIVTFPSRERSKWVWATRMAAAIAVLGSVASIGWFSGRTNEVVLAEEPAASGFAVIADQSNATWHLSRGDLIPDGPVTLEAGTVQLELFSGVTVMIEGQATFEVLSAMEMRVDRGQVRALVPPLAEGFRISTATGKVVDLGTEFAIDVHDTHADLHIIDGEIEWHPLNRAMHSIKEGESMRWNADGHMESLPFAAQSVADIKASLAQQRNERRSSWQHHMESWKQDPRGVIYFPMVRPSTDERYLMDMSSPSHHGTIVRAAQVTDRWGHSHAALDFSPMGSRVRVDIPEELQALTFYCWVKIDSLDRWYNSLFLTDGHELNEPHWQIMNDGRLFFSVKAHDRKGPNSPDKQICYSPSFWDPSLSGKWLQIATTFDSTSGQVAHYVNGKAISHETVRDAMRVDKIHIGAASIGNWSEPERNDPHFAVRNLNGAIDEFMLFNAALSAEEIDQLHQAGKP